MFQGKKKTSKSTQRRPKNNSKSYSISTSVFTDNRPKSLLQRKLSKTIEQKSDINNPIAFSANDIPSSLIQRKSENLNTSIAQLQDEKSSKEQADYLSGIDLKTADLEKEGIEKGKDPNKSDDNQEYYKAVAWDPSLLEKKQENEDSEAGGSKEKEEKKKKDEPNKEPDNNGEKEKYGESTSFQFMLAGLVVEGEINSITKEGKALSTGGPLGEVFELEGSIAQKDDNSGFTINATTRIKGFETPDLIYSLPLARVPLGIPGVFASVDMDLTNSANLGGNFGISCETDNNIKNVQNINLNAVSVDVGAKASIGIFGGVSIGVPTLGEISVGGEGSAEANLNASANITATSEGIILGGVLFGEAKGKLAAIAKAQILFMTKKKSIPIVEGVIGSFEKEITGTTINDEESLKALPKFGPSNFKRNKKAEVPEKAADSFIDNPEENPKKASWLSRNMPSFFRRKK